MAVKWNGHLSKPYPLPGGGAQGGQLGQLEYLSQSNDNVNFLSKEEKFKFIDDLSILELINLVMSGMSSYNFKQHVASDIGVHGQYLPPTNIYSQDYMDQVCHWTDDKQMALVNMALTCFFFQLSRLIWIQKQVFKTEMKR